jgi:dTDP-4-amino-4,6-dideoxygalactose transaminase
LIGPRIGSEMKPTQCDCPKPEPIELPCEFPGAIWYCEEELDAVCRVLRNRSPFRYYGPNCTGEVAQLEQEFARFLASQPGQPWPEQSPLHVTAVNSGTGALEIALDALGVGAGDEVLVQGFMWISSISAIVRNRAIPVLVDSDDTLNMDPASIRARVTERTKVIMPVPMLGGSARIGAIMEEVRSINRQRLAVGLAPIRVLEDCAQSMGAHASGAPGSIEPQAASGIHRVGTFGDVGIFSLQINKNITAGEGGLIVSRDPELARTIDALHNTGYARDSQQPINWYGDQPIGWGHGRRLGEMQGAVARVQLRRLDNILQNMRDSHDRLESFVKSLGLRTRRRADSASPGDTGYYCQFHLPAQGLTLEQKIDRGRSVAAALHPYHLRPWFMHDFEVHVYYNITPLVEKWPLNQGGPWDWGAPEHAHLYEYSRGTLPHLDEMLVTTIGINVPSALTPEMEAYIQSVLAYVKHAVIDQPA